MDDGLSNLFTIFLSFLGSGTASAVILAVLNRYWKKKDEKEAKNSVTPEMITNLEGKIDKCVNAQRVIMKDRIRYLGTCYIYAGEISIDDKSTLHEMHDVAEDLELNGSLDVVMGEVDSLPIKSTPQDKP